MTISIYELTRDFPNAERYGLSEQLRRASSSVGSNIAEGCGRSSNADFVRFLTIAAGSASEVQYQLLLSRDLGYLESEQFRMANYAAHEVKRLLHGLIGRTR